MKVNNTTMPYRSAFSDLERLVLAGAGMLDLIQGQLVIGGVTPDQLDEVLRGLLLKVSEVADAALAGSRTWTCEECGRKNTVKVWPSEDVRAAITSSHSNLSPDCPATLQETLVILSQETSAGRGDSGDSELTR